MELLLIKYGYFLLFLGVAVEGEASLLAATYLVHQGLFRLNAVLVVAIAANFIANQIYYLVARSRGQAWLENRFRENSHYRRALSWMSKHANWLLLLSRYAFGFRIIIPAACGALGMPLLRFTGTNLVSSIIWAIPVVLIGLYFGGVAESAIVDVQRYQVWIVAGIVAVGMFVLLVRHLRHAEWVEDLKTVDIHTLAPFLIGVMGAINIFSAIWPRSPLLLHDIASWLPLEVTQRSRPLMLLAGVTLLQVTRNLARRKELAWDVAFIALLVSFLTHITRALDLHHSAVAGFLLAYLWISRRRFYARSDPASLRRALLMMPALGLTIFVYGYVGLNEQSEQYAWHDGSTPARESFQSGILIGEPGLSPNTPHAALFLESLQIAGWLARFYLLALILRPVILRRREEASDDEIKRIFSSHSVHSLSAFAIQDDKHHMLTADGNALIAYAVRGSVALASGDPLVSEADFEAAVRQYVEYCRRNGWTPCIYEAAEERLAVYRALGMRSLKMAEEALIDLREFSLSGNKRANLRAMVNKTAKSGMSVCLYDRSRHIDPNIDEQLEEISQEWLEEKRIGELGFSLGRFSLEALFEVPVFIADLQGRIEAFCTWLPYGGGKAVVLDLMRKRTVMVAGTMDYLIAHSLLQLKAEGYAEASLANAPLANVSQPSTPLDRGVALLFDNMNAFYGYKNLFQFKKKFAPRWEGRYLIYPKGADLPRVAYALARVHSRGSLLRLLLKR
jgi:phosphatidylglycerol lysyltransferase